MLYFTSEMKELWLLCTYFNCMTKYNILNKEKLPGKYEHVYLILCFSFGEFLSVGQTTKYKNLCTAFGKACIVVQWLIWSKVSLCICLLFISAFLFSFRHKYLSNELVSAAVSLVTKCCLFSFGYKDKMTWVIILWIV